MKQNSYYEYIIVFLKRFYDEHIIQMKLRISIYLLSALLLQACYSFKGITIPDTLDTFDVPFVEVTTPDAPPSINTDLQDKLIQKITRESRLTFNSTNPDVRMTTKLTGYIVESIGANSEDVDANRLKISVKVEYKDAKNEENDWIKSFSQNREFAAGVNLLSVQDQLVEEIFDDIVEDIFNTAFTNW